MPIDCGLAKSHGVKSLGAAGGDEKLDAFGMPIFGGQDQGVPQATRAPKDRVLPGCEEKLDTFRVAARSSPADRQRVAVVWICAHGKEISDSCEIACFGVNFQVAVESCVIAVFGVNVQVAVEIGHKMRLAGWHA